MLRGYREEKQVALKPINEDVCEGMCMCFTEEVKKKKKRSRRQKHSLYTHRSKKIKSYVVKTSLTWGGANEKNNVVM